MAKLALIVKEIDAYLSGKSPKDIIEAALKGEGSLRGDELGALVEQVMADVAQRQPVLEMAMIVKVGGRRKQRWQNDVANFAAIKSLGLEQIQCPVLLIHGDADTDAPPSYSESAHAHLRRSELVIISRGTHLSFYAHPEDQVRSGIQRSRDKVLKAWSTAFLETNSSIC